MVTLLTWALVPLALALRALLQDVVLPAWLTTAMPALVMALTWLLANIPAVKAFGMRNVAAVVALVLAVIVVGGGIAPTPDIPAWSGDVWGFFGGLAAWATWAYGLWLYFFKAAQVLYDALTGQLATPEGHAEGA